MPASSKNYRHETRLVHAGTLRSQFNEMSEALFLTQGYKYESAEDCELRFSGKIPGYVYSRYNNPTMDMFEQRMAALEGAEAARSTATGMAAVTTALMGLVKAGDHVVAAKALFGSCCWVIEEWLPRFGVTSTVSPSRYTSTERVPMAYAAKSGRPSRSSSGRAGSLSRVGSSSPARERVSASWTATPSSSSAEVCGSRAGVPFSTQSPFAVLE